VIHNITWTCSLAESLSERFRWQQAQATLFVLTGKKPLVDLIEIKRHTNPIRPSLNRIVITVDPAIAPREVMRVYAAVRSSMLPRRIRRLSEKHQRLAQFWGSKKSSATTGKLMEKWNDLYPEWKNGQTFTFKRDATTALKRVTGNGELPAIQNSPK